VAQKLLDESWAADADQPEVAAALGELAANRGDDAKALDYLISARLGGEISPSTIEALSSAYSKAHNGSSAGLEDSLDAEYHKRFPNPLHLDAYQPTAKRSDRLVLAEVFTGSGCGPCVGADLAFEAAMERYSRKDLAVVMYHQHVPRPDPMSNPDSQARSKYYAVAGVPTYFIDGGRVEFNGADREDTKGVFEHIQPVIEKELEAPAEERIDISTSVLGNSVKITAGVAALKSQSKDLKIHILLVEKELKYSGENGIRFHPMVVRAMGGKDDDGFPLEPGAPVSVEQAWDLDQVSAGLKTHLDDYEAKGHRGNSFKFIEKKYRIDRGSLAIVVFVQDAKTKHVLQSAFVDLNPPAAHAATSNAGEPK
jgi:thiol-disulfide isomerase/thioredoxin